MTAVAATQAATVAVVMVAFLAGWEWWMRRHLPHCDRDDLGCHVPGHRHPRRRA